MKTLRLSSVFATILIALAIILVGLHASRSAASSSTASLARQQALPPPHLGYGLNVWDRPQLAAGLGFDWLKLFEEAGCKQLSEQPRSSGLSSASRGFT